MREESHRRDWEELARVDPLWAILSFPSKRFRRWDQEEFMATGDAQVSHHLGRAAELGYPARRRSVLDFGCGVGRLAPALSSRFDSYTGVDISEGMVVQARRRHAAREGCRFVTGTHARLAQFPDGSFDLVFSLYVLQHLARSTTIVTYLREFLRLLAPGGLAVFQLPSSIPPAEKLLYDTRRALHLSLRAIGVPTGVLHRVCLSPIAMRFVADNVVVSELTDAGGRVLDIEAKPGGMAIHDRTYYVTASP